MEDISSFRGLSGEVVRGFLRPSVFLTAVPLLVCWGFFLGFMFFIGNKLPPFFLPLFFLCFLGALLSRFALPASRGEFHTGFFGRLEKGECLRFAGRYAVLTLLWIGPLLFLARKIFVIYFNHDFAGHFTSPSLVDSMGFSGVLFAIFIVLSLTLPFLSVLICTYTESIRELFSAAPYQWLFSVRRGDIGPFFANVYGGSVAFFLYYFLPTIFLVYLGFMINVSLGNLLGNLFTFVPFLLMPVLIGRLSGAFIAGEADLSAEYSGSARMLPARALADPIVAAAIAKKYPSEEKITQKLVLGELLSPLESLDEASLQTHIEKLEMQVKMESPNAAHKTQLAFLLQRAGRTEESIVCAGAAIKLALGTSNADLAADIYLAFSQQREELGLDLPTLERLCSALVEQQHFAHAGWCMFHMHAIAKNAEAELRAERRCLNIAETARKVGRNQDALVLYRSFAKKFPQSGFIDFVNNAIEAEEKKLQ